MLYVDNNNMNIAKTDNGFCELYYFDGSFESFEGNVPKGFKEMKLWENKMVDHRWFHQLRPYLDEYLPKYQEEEGEEEEEEANLNHLAKRYYSKAFCQLNKQQKGEILIASWEESWGCGI